MGMNDCWRAATAAGTTGFWIPASAAVCARALCCATNRMHAQIAVFCISLLLAGRNFARSVLIRDESRIHPIGQVERTAAAGVRNYQVDEPAALRDSYVEPP